jgi:hypothetical protein
MAFRSGGEPRTPLGSGIDCFLMQDNTVLAYSTDMNVSEDYQLERVTTLGYFGSRDILSLGYNCSFNLGTFLLRGADIAGSVAMPGWQADGNNNINSAGLYTFTVLDVHTLTVLATVMGAKYGGGDIAISVGQLLRRSTKWEARMLLPGLQTS